MDVAARRPECEQPVDLCDEGGFIDVLAIQDREPRAALVAPQVQVVATGCLADERDLGNIGARAAVRTTGDPKAERLAGEVVLSEHRFDPLKELGQIAFGLRHGKRTGRKGNAGKCVPPDRGALLRRLESMASHECIDRLFPAGRNTGDRDVLVRRDPKVTLMDLRDFPETREPGAIWPITDSPCRDPKRSVPGPV